MAVLLDVSAAATIADTSSSTAMPQPPPSARRRAPTSRPAIRRASRDRRPWALRPTPMNASGGAASWAERYASSAAAITAVLVDRVRRACRSSRSSRSGSARIVVRFSAGICTHIYHAGRRASASPTLRPVRARLRARTAAIDRPTRRRRRVPLRAQPPDPRPDPPAPIGARGRWAPDDQPPRPRVRGLAGPNRSPHAGCLLYTSDAADDLLCVDLG